MSYLVVEFSSKLKEFAVLSINNVLDGNLRAQSTKLLGKTVDVLWGRKPYSAKVRGVGTKIQMEAKCNSLAEEAAHEVTVPEENDERVDKPSCSKTSPAGRILSVLNKRKLYIQTETPDTQTSKVIRVCSSPRTVASHVEQTSENLAPSIENDQEPVEDPTSTILNLTNKVEKLKASVRKHKERANELDRQLLELRKQQGLSSSEDAVEISPGTGVFLEKALLAAAKLTSKTPPILARNLFRQLFKPEEMRGHSLFGRTCNANKSAEVFPSIDGVKRDAIIQCCLNAYNLKPLSGSCKRGQVSEFIVQKTRIIDSLNKLLREENSKLN